VEGVASATAQLFIKPAKLTCCFNVDMFLVAFDPESDFTVRPWLERNLSRPLGPEEIITGRNIPVVTGDAVPFFGTSFRVAGTLEPTGMDFFDQAAFMSLEAAYRMADQSATRAVRRLELERGAISTVLVRVTEDLTPDRVAIRIEHDVPAVKALVSDTVISTVRRQLAGLIHAIVLISGVLWCIVLLVMAFAFTMIVNERRRELGLLRAMGANRRQAAALVLAEASILSAVGGAAGIALGFGLLVGFKDLLLLHLRLPYLFPPPSQAIALTVAALAFSLITGLLSAALPSLSVVRMAPYEAIRRAG